MIVTIFEFRVGSSYLDMSR